MERMARVSRQDIDSVANCGGRDDKDKTQYGHRHQGLAAPAHTRYLMILAILLICVRILTLLIGSTKFTVGAVFLAVRAVSIMVPRLEKLIQIEGKLRRGRKLTCLSTAIRGGSLAEAIIGRRRVLATVDLRDQLREFCNRIAFAVRREMFVIHRGSPELNSRRDPEA